MAKVVKGFFFILNLLAEAFAAFLGPAVEKFQFLTVFWGVLFDGIAPLRNTSRKI